MAEVFSPQVIVNERDISNIAPAVSTTITAIVGGATKGPLNEPTFVSSPSQFVEIFGEPTPEAYGPYAAINFLREGNQLYYVRVASEEGSDPIFNATTDQPAVYVSAPITNPSFSGDVTFSIRGQSLTIPFSAANTGSLQKIADAITAALQAAATPRLGYARVNGDRIEVVSHDRGPTAVVAVTNSTGGAATYFVPGSAQGYKNAYTVEALTPATLQSTVVPSGVIDTTTTYAAISGSASGPYDVGNVAKAAYTVIQVDTAPASGEILQIIDNNVSAPNLGLNNTHARFFGSNLSNSPTALFNVGDAVDLLDSLNNPVGTGIIDALHDFVGSTTTSGFVFVKDITWNPGYDINDVDKISFPAGGPYSNSMGVSNPKHAGYAFVAGVDFSINGSTTDIAQSIAAAINVKTGGKLVAEATNNQVKISFATPGANGNYLVVGDFADVAGDDDTVWHGLTINGISVVDGAYDSTYGIYNFQHGFDAITVNKKSYDVVVDGVTTNIDFDVIPSSIIPNTREATAQQIADAINYAVGTDVAFVTTSGGTDTLTLQSPTAGADGTIAATQYNFPGGADPASNLLPTGSATGTGDNYLKFEVDNKWVIDVYFTQSSALPLSQVAAEINTAASAVDPSLANVASVVGDSIVLTSPTKGSKAEFGSSIILHNDLGSLFGASPLPYEVEGTGQKKAAITIIAATPGTWGNNITVVFADEEDQFATPNSSRVDVYYNGALVESFREVVIDPTSDQFVETIVNGNSNYITIDFDEDAFDLDPNTLSSSVKLAVGSYNLEGGANGLAALGDAEIVGVDKDALTGRPTGLRALADTERLFINIVAAPGHTSQNVADALVALAEERADTLAIIDPPFGLTATEVVEWHNGLGHGRTSAINSSFAATYDTWLLQFDPYSSQDIYMPPSVHILAQFAYNDRVAEPWFAAAGLNRGKLTYAKDVYYKSTLGERELMFQGTNRVNPIVKFIGEGIFVWGNQTLYRKESPLRDITVRRLLNFAKTIVTAAARNYLFEPNNEASRQRIVETINPVFDEIRRKRGLTTFRVVDNTTDRDINLGRVRITVFLQPTRSINVIQIDFAITEQGGAFVL